MVHNRPHIFFHKYGPAAQTSPELIFHIIDICLLICGSDVPDFTHTINLNIADVGATVHICTEINYVCTGINLYSQVISSDKSVHQILL